MKNFYFVLALITCITFGDAFAQIKTLSGFAADSISGDPLPGVNAVIVSKEDGRLITGTATDSTGKFEIKNIRDKDVILKLSMVGYNTKTIDALKEGSLGKVFLSQSAVKLGDVEVKAQKPMLEYSLDKTIINIDKVPGNNASVSDALKNTGLIDVDPTSKKISVRGNSAVNIMIDGHPVQMGDELLSQMPASYAEKVELTTVPSAKEDPEGGAGILNIITKKNVFDNYSGSATIYGSTGNVGMANLMLNYRKNNFSINASTFTFLGKFGGSSDADRINYNSDALHEIISKNTTSTNGNYRGYNLGIDYDPDTLNSLSFSANYGLMKFSNDNGSVSDNFNISRELIYNYYSQSNVNYKYGNYSTSGFYKHKFNNKGHEFTTDAYFTNQDNFNGTDLISHYNYTIDFPSYQMSHQSEKNNTFILKTDYVNPTDEYGKFEVGYKLTYRNRKNDYTNKNFLYIEDVWGDSLGLSNIFKYDETIHAGYITYTRKISIFDVKAGLRLEQTFAEGTQEVTNETFNNDYLSLFPSLSVAYSISPLYQVSFNASRRINRPRMDQINPFVFVYGPNSETRGNSRIEPTYTNIFELAFSSLLKFYYSRTTGNVVSFNTVRNDSIFVTSYVNATSTKTYGAELNIPIMNGPGMPFKLPDWLQIFNISLSYSYMKEDAGYLNDQYAIDRGSFRMTDYLSLKLWYDVTFSVYASYTPKTTDDRFYNSSRTFAGFSVGKNFFDKKLEVTFNAQDIFKGQNGTSKTTAPSFYSYNKYTAKYTPNYGISLRYSFNNYQQKQDRNVDDGRDNSGNRIF